MLAEMWVTGSDPGSGYPQMNGVKSENISISCPPFWVNNIFLTKHKSTFHTVGSIKLWNRKRAVELKF